MSWAVMALSSAQILIRPALTFAINNRKCRITSLSISSSVITSDHVCTTLFASVSASLVLIRVATACAIRAFVGVVSESGAALSALRYTTCKFTI